MKVSKYDSSDRDAWNRFVEESKNGTFLHLRSYMDYHADRFEDFSCMVYSDGGDLIALLVMGILGWVMKQHGWPRPAALIGYVLSDNIETYLFISVQRYGLSWIARRGVIILALIIAASLAMGIFWQTKKGAKSGGGRA